MSDTALESGSDLCMSFHGDAAFQQREVPLCARHQCHGQCKLLTAAEAHATQDEGLSETDLRPRTNRPLRQPLAMSSSASSCVNAPHDLSMSTKHAAMQPSTLRISVSFFLVVSCVYSIMTIGVSKGETWMEVCSALARHVWDAVDVAAVVTQRHHVTAPLLISAG